MLLYKTKDYKLRSKYKKIEYKKKILKFITTNLLCNLNLSKKKKRSYLIETLLSVKLKNFSLISKVKIIRRCIFHNRSYGVTRKFNLSRSIFRELLQFGLIPGYKKAVW